MATDSFGTGTPGDDAFPSIDSLTYEHARDELIETVKILELGQLSLDESLKYSGRCQALAKACDSQLDGASKLVEEALDARSAESSPTPDNLDDNQASEAAENPENFDY